MRIWIIIFFAYRKKKNQTEIIIPIWKKSDFFKLKKIRQHLSQGHMLEKYSNMGL